MLGFVSFYFFFFFFHILTPIFKIQCHFYDKYCALECTFKWKIQQIVFEYGKVNTLNAQENPFFQNKFLFFSSSSNFRWIFHLDLTIFFFSFQLLFRVEFCHKYFMFSSFSLYVLKLFTLNLDKNSIEKFTHDFVHFEFCFDFSFFDSMCLHRSQIVFWF